ncbi:HPr family phosphocarrier protein [Microbacterium sp. 18062]|uniref:HPr family phosphocarrier protein n=1 Tax=Microbacterium sp. 18062 TaxID=2681410 RepID=UPI001356EAFD|nr:HPr family phosphocarrier protein [Microbacterium sp. 18062]
MIERAVTFGSRLGLHARPASRIARAAAKHRGTTLTIAAEGAPPDQAKDATSLLSLLSIGAEYGDVLVVRGEGVSAQEAVDELEALLLDELDGGG